MGYMHASSQYPREERGDGDLCGGFQEEARKGHRCLLLAFHWSELRSLIFPRREEVGLGNVQPCTGCIDENQPGFSSIPERVVGGTGSYRAL